MAAEKWAIRKESRGPECCTYVACALLLPQPSPYEDEKKLPIRAILPFPVKFVRPRTVAS
jgi:hypothetical protein